MIIQISSLWTRSLVLFALAAGVAAAQPTQLMVVTTSLANGTVGLTYAQPLAAAGGTGGNVWSVVAGSLPAGLSLSSAGLISGTPTGIGIANFTVQVMDSSNATATRPLSIAVLPVQLEVATTSLANGAVGAIYSQTLAASGGSGGYVWSVAAGSLPLGLSLSAAGLINGTPTVAGTLSFTVQVMDSSNAAAIQTLSIAIAPAQLTVATASLASGIVGVIYSQTLSASGGTGGNIWSIVSGSLPAGFALSTAGLISGNPAAPGIANFTVQVMDSSNATATKPLSITIVPAQLSVTTTSLPSGTIGIAYLQTLAANGGTGGNTWSLSGGSLPAGLSLSSAGVISGTPTSIGTANFTVQVTDNSNTTAAMPLNIAIAPPQLTITTTSLANGTAGASYSQTLAASGGTGGNTWSVIGGSLPAGISLSAAGVIGGTPTAAGTANFTVQVADSSNATATKVLSIVISPAQLTVTTALLANGTVGAAYSQTIAASGGTGGNTWSVIGGSLPAGILLSAAGVISGTPTAAGTANFTVQVADSSNATATKALSIVISPAQLTVTTTSLANGTVGAAYSQTLAASGGTGGNIWSVIGGSLPAGILLSAAGVISGTPTGAGTANFTVQVADSSNATATKALGIVISPAQLTVTTTSLVNGTVGAAYSQTLAASGGTGGNTWSVIGGSLPAGLSLSAAGLISGTATTAGTANFTVQVADSSSATASKALSIVISPAQLTVTTTSLANGTVGAAYSQTLAASGGTGGNTWSVIGGSLPAGILLSAAGAISGTPTAAGTANFTVQVADSSNATASKALSIVISPAQLTVTTTSLANGTVGVAYSQMLAASGGTGGNTWSVISGSLPAGLSLSGAGLISGTAAIAGTANFTVQAMDSSSASATMPLAITIAPAQLTVTTTSLANGTVGLAYSQTLAASGGTGGNAWSVTAGSVPAGLSLNAAGVISGTPTTAGTTNVTVQVTDSSSATATKALSITIAAPQLTVTTTSVANGTVGLAYSQTLAASGGTGGNAWSTTAGSLPAGLSLSAAGVISGTPTTAGTSNVTVQVTDSSSATATKAFSITIASPQLTVTTTSVANGTVGLAYSQTLAASGGTGGNAWSVAAGSLPAGLSINAAGVISGTPTTAGTTNVTVQVTDSSSATATKALSITIAAPQLTVTTTSLANGTVGTAYSQTLAASGGTGGNAWNITTGSLPAGLSLNAAGVISGTPTAAGTTNVTVQVTDSSSATATKALSITIASPQLTVTTTSLANGTVNAAYSQTLAATGGTGGNAWSTTTGSLPVGLSLSAAGVISGMPTTAGTSNLTVQVTDSSSATASKALSITIASPQLTVTTTSLSNGTVGTAYSQTLAASGGTGGNAWSTTTGSLPGGLSLSAAGVISGTPTTAGTSNLTVQVTDSSSATATKALSITIASPQLTVTTTSLANGTVGAAYSQTLAASGGTGGNAWSVTTGSLPAGLSLSAAGVISGTPTTAGTTNVTVQVTDSSSSTATKALSITIASPQLTVTTTSLANGTVGAAYSQTLAASGGTGGNAWSITTGSLPAGLSLSAAGVISGTPTTTGTTNVTVRVTDSSSATATKALSITIASPQLTVTTTSLANGTAGVAYSQTLAASGGTGGIAWSTTAGLLPAGLSLSNAGVITGTPTTAGTTNVTVQVMDSSSATATKALSITIASPQLTVTTTSLANGTAGTAYSQTLAASGGTGGNSWSLTTTGSLPAGLSLSAAGVITGTPTAAGATNFTVRVADSSNAAATKALSITIVSPQLTVTTTSLANGTMGAAYSQTISGSGGTGGNAWSVTTGSLPAGLSLSAAGMISGTPTAAGTSNFTVRVADSSNAAATKALSITIASPELTVTTTSLANGTVGAAYSQTLAASGGTGGNAWSITTGSLPAGLSLSAAGVISGTPTAAGATNFTVRVADNSSAAATKALSIVIAATPLTITSTSLTNGTVGIPYSQTLIAAGGSGGNAWSVVSGSLPAGLSLSAAGAISGTPASPGSSTFEVRVTDAASAAATRAFTISILSQIVITTRTLRNGVLGSSYTESLTASGGLSPYNWSVISGQLPPGLTLERVTGTISGTPSIAGMFNILVEVSDTTQARTSISLSLTINRPLTLTTPVALATASAGSRYTQTFTATGGTPPYSWAASGTLPPGLTLSATTGVLSGTPTQVGTFPISIRVTDSTSGTATGNYSVQVVSGLAIATPPILPTATSGTAYSSTLQPAGGSAPYQWTVIAGTLPNGLTFNPAGEISGTPNASGSFLFTAQVTDANLNTAQKAFTLNVAGPLLITTATTLPAGVTQSTYTQAIVATGGTPPYQWSITGDAPPPGLTLSAPTGILSGRPTATGSYSFTATVTDSMSLAAQKQFTLTVSQGVTFTSPATLPDASAGLPYTFALEASGGVSPYAWSVVDGGLPNGLSLNATAGTISGTPSTSGTFNFTVQVVDSVQTTITRVHSLVVGLPTLAQISLNGLPASSQPLQQPLIDVALAAPYPVPVTGILTLSFTPMGDNPDDPAVQFSTGGRSAAFTIPANATHATFGVSQFAVQTGSVAGNITISFASLQGGGGTLNIPPNLSQTIEVSRVVPVIRSVALARTSDGIQVQITGMSNTRELSQASILFEPAAGSSLQSSQLVVPLGEVARSWFASGDSIPFGGQFNLILPFTFSGNVSLSSVSVTLTNGVGTSSATSVTY